MYPLRSAASPLPVADDATGFPTAPDDLDRPDILNTLANVSRPRGSRGDRALTRSGRAPDDPTSVAPAPAPPSRTASTSGTDLQPCVDALLDDPDLPAPLRLRLNQWGSSEDQQAQAMAEMLTEGFRPLATALEWPEADYQSEVVPALKRAAVLLVAANLEDPVTVAARLLGSYRRDDELDNVGRYLLFLVGECVPSILIWTQRLFNSASAAEGGQPDTASLRRLASSGWLAPALCGLLHATAVSMRQACRRIALLDPTPHYTHALARQLERRWRGPAEAQRDVDANLHWFQQMVSRVLLTPGLVALTGPLTHDARLTMDYAVNLVSLEAHVLWGERLGRRPMPPLLDYSLLVLSQRDLPQRIERLERLHQLPKHPFGRSSASAPSAFGWPRASTWLHAAVVGAGLLAQSLWLDPPPLSRRWMAGASGADAVHAGTPTVSAPYSARETMLDGLQVALISTLLTYATLTVRAHAPAIDARARDGLDRLQQWWQGPDEASMRDPPPNRPTGATTGLAHAPGRGDAVSGRVRRRRALPDTTGARGALGAADGEDGAGSAAVFRASRSPSPANSAYIPGIHRQRATGRDPAR